MCSDLIAERLHVKFCKYVSEVSRRSTNIAIAGGLGRYPLFLEVILNMIKYYIHLSIPICTGFVVEAFEASRKLHLENKRSWYRNIAEVIDYFGMDKCKIFNLKSTQKIIYSIFFIWNTKIPGKIIFFISLNEKLHKSLRKFKFLRYVTSVHCILDCTLILSTSNHWLILLSLK